MNRYFQLNFLHSFCEAVSIIHFYRWSLLTPGILGLTSVLKLCTGHLNSTKSVVYAVFLSLFYGQLVLSFEHAPWHSYMTMKEGRGRGEVSIENVGIWAGISSYLLCLFVYSSLSLYRYWFFEVQDERRFREKKTYFFVKLLYGFLS